MSESDRTEQEFYDHIAAEMEDSDTNPAYDHVMSWADWKMFKAAMLRWLDDQEQEWIKGLDQRAVEGEHDV